MKKSIQYNSTDEKDTIRCGEQLARHLKVGDIVCLQGDLGSGKTTLVKGMAKGLGVSPQKVHSPTFVLMNIYKGKSPLYHFDFYRLDKVQEIPIIGYDEFLYGQGVAVIEWPERMGDLLPTERLDIKLTHQGENERRLEFYAVGKRAQQILNHVTL